MKKSVKILFLLIICVITINLIFSVKVHATDGSKQQGMFEAADEFLKHGLDNKVNEAALAEVSRNIYYPFLAVAIGIAVIVGAYLGIKIMVATVEEKAKVKEMLIPYIVGVFVIFSTFGIWSTVVKIGTSIVGEGTFNPAVDGQNTTINKDATVNINNAPVYSAADTTSSVIRYLNSGDRIHVIESNNRLYKVVVYIGGPTRTGFMTTDSVTLDS